MLTKQNNLRAAIEAAQMVKIKKNDGEDYNFKLYAFGERGTFIEPELITEITENLAQSITEEFSNFDYLVSPEPGGHTWGMLAAYRLNKPINILRLSTQDNQTAADSIKRETAYNENYISFAGFKSGDRVLLVDDVISSGGTIYAIVPQLRNLGVEIAGIQVILVKGEHYKKMKSDLSVPIKYLAKI
ncbi:phosphoribosyltransferase family protein [Pelosinus sp. sgz500959]|uniref:phosphoribosyltransferase family protein n=1 Tax=Pelosinus sp. sgz500959 TaxID=3242472 RepID=UPI0036709AB7